MKITKNDIKVLNKIKKLCDKRGCKECEFAMSYGCILQNQVNWWELDEVKIIEKGE